MSPHVEHFGIGEAAKRSGLSRTTLRRYVAAGRVDAFVLPTGQLRFTDEGLSRILLPAKSRRKAEVEK